MNNIDYSNYYNYLTSVMSEDKAAFIINLIQLQLLDDMIDNFTEVMKDMVTDLPMLEGKEYRDARIKLDLYIEVVRDIKDTWTYKYKKVEDLRNEQR